MTESTSVSSTQHVVAAILHRTGYLALRAAALVEMDEVPPIDCTIDTMEADANWLSMISRMVMQHCFPARPLPARILRHRCPDLHQCK